MLKAIVLLEAEIERIMKLAVVLRQTGLPIRADYREAEVSRFNKILDLLYIERRYG
jgi:hypothetical protein